VHAFDVTECEAYAMPNLPDPRCFAAAHTNPLQKLAEKIVAESDAMQRERFREELQQDLRQTMRAGRDDLLSAALTEVSSPEAGSCLWDAVDQALNTPADDKAGLVASLFALPIVFVSAGPEGREVPGVVKDARKLARVLEEHGALGVHQNFGLNPALCADTSVEAFSLSRLYALLRRVEAERVDIWPDLIPAEIELNGQERVDLRFVTGIVVAGVNAPSLASTASDVSRWGMPFSKELISQITPRGVTLLPIPRPPSGLLKALYRGHRSREEVAFQTFISRVVRDMRSSVGEPAITLTAVEPQTIEIHVAAAIGGEMATTHRWQLHPLDQLPSVSRSILELLAEMQVERVTVVEEVVSNDAQRASPGETPP
jgi:hypothetical protein